MDDSLHFEKDNSVITPSLFTVKVKELIPSVVIRPTTTTTTTTNRIITPRPFHRHDSQVEDNNSAADESEVNNVFNDLYTTIGTDTNVYVTPTVKLFTKVKTVLPKQVLKNTDQDHTFSTHNTKQLSEENASHSTSSNNSTSLHNNSISTSQFTQKRMDIETTINDLKAQLQRFATIRDRMRDCMSFDDADVDHVVKYMTEMQNTCNEKERELDAWGDKRECCEEMETKMENRMKLLRDCEGLIDFQTHATFAKFFVSRQLRLNEIYQKMLNI